MHAFVFAVLLATTLSTDMPKTTVEGATFIAPAGWSIEVKGPATILSAQVALILGRLLPKGYSRESFAGKKANKLDAKRIAALSAFVEEGRKKLGVPGVSIGLVQDGKVVFEGGFGVRDISSTAKPDGNT